jgi:hypothetical protein
MGRVFCPAIASDLTRRFGHGAHLARLALDPTGPIRWARTRGEGHYTIWGTLAELLARVVEIVALEIGQGEAQ